MTAPIVTTTSGKVQGKQIEGGFAYLGIPYAEPIGGAARFAAPTPRRAWDGVRDATRHGAVSKQSQYPAPFSQYLPSTTSAGDDCLNVAVWTPDPGASGLPVIVWIHGGAFVRGANSLAVYDGSAFARDGVVLVGVNYRLGVPGFAVLDGAPNNRGLRDQILALEWVRENVSAFGGDPDNVTIMGESAGAMSVVSLIASRKADGLFRRAIAQSGGGQCAAPVDDARAYALAVAQYLGVKPTAAAMSRLGGDEIFAAQEKASADYVADPDPQRWGSGFVAGGLGLMTSFPVIDGDVLTDRPEQVLAHQGRPDVGLLIGITRQEYNFWAVGTGLLDKTTDANLHTLAARFGAPSTVVDAYRSRRAGERPGQVLSDIATDVMFREPALRLVDLRQGKNTYVYEFAWRTPEHGLGACHALDLPFTFDTLGAAREYAPGPHAPHSVADLYHRSFVDFATSGNPGWAQFADGRRTRVFDVGGPRDESDLRTEDRAVWRDAGSPKEPQGS